MVIGNLWVVWDAFVTGVHTVTERISFLPTKPVKIDEISELISPVVDPDDGFLLGRNLKF